MALVHIEGQKQLEQLIRVVQYYHLKEKIDSLLRHEQCERLSSSIKLYTDVYFVSRFTLVTD